MIFGFGAKEIGFRKILPAHGVELMPLDSLNEEPSDSTVAQVCTMPITIETDVIATV